MLYALMRKEKVPTKIKFNLNEHVIQNAQQETEKWDNERTEEINKLKEQEEFRKEFIGNLAHELKTPVFSIQGYILSLLDGGLEDPSVNRQFLERAEKATDRITQILEDLDQITKIENDLSKLKKRPFDIIELSYEVIHELERNAKTKAIELKIESSDSQINVNADRIKIYQVLSNLVNNSINYGVENGITTIKIYKIDDLVSIEVSDNGMGIEGKYLPRLFERFYRVEKSRNRNEGGSGLGLSIVRSIIEAHDKTITVKSTPGEGSNFSFCLDAVKGSGELYSSRGIQIK